MDNPIYEYSAKKNLKLLRERGVCFEDVISVLDEEGPLSVIDHPNPKKYPGQKIYLVELDNYIYLVTFERKGNKAILKTIYPSRKMTRLYKKQEENDHE